MWSNLNNNEAVRHESVSVQMRGLPSRHVFRFAHRSVTGDQYFIVIYSSFCVKKRGNSCLVPLRLVVQPPSPSLPPPHFLHLLIYISLKGGEAYAQITPLSLSPSHGFPWFRVFRTNLPGSIMLYNSAIARILSLDRMEKEGKEELSNH